MQNPDQNGRRIAAQADEVIEIHQTDGRKGKYQPPSTSQEPEEIQIQADHERAGSQCDCHSGEWDECGQ